MGNVLEYVLAAATILSFLLALVPYFEKYKPQIKFAFVFISGMLVGSIVARAAASQVSITFEGSAFQAMLLVMMAVAGIIILVTLLSFSLSNKDSVSENNPKIISGFGSFGLFIVLAFISGLSSCSIQTNRLDSGEYLTLAKYYESSGDISRSLEYYQKLLRLEHSTGGTGDEQFIQTINGKITELMAKTDAP